MTDVSFLAAVGVVLTGALFLLLWHERREVRALRRQVLAVEVQLESNGKQLAQLSVAMGEMCVRLRAPSGKSDSAQGFPGPHVEEVAPAEAPVARLWVAGGVLGGSAAGIREDVRT